MDGLKRLAQLDVLLVAIAALGSLYVVVLAGASDARILVVLALTLVVVAALTVNGLRSAGVTDTPYW